MATTKEKHEKDILSILKEEDRKGYRVERGPDRRLRLVLDTRSMNGNRWNCTSVGMRVEEDFPVISGDGDSIYPDEDYGI